MNEYDGELTTWRPDGMKVVQTYKNGVANGWQKNYNSQGVRILICVNGGLKHVNTPDSYLRERCAKRAASALSVA